MFNQSEKEILSIFLLAELKRVKHYSPNKSRNLISIATKSDLKDDLIKEMKELFKEYYQNDY